MKPDFERQVILSEPTETATVNDTFACTPEKKPFDVSSNSGSLATPPVSKRFAPKKRRIDLNYEN